MRIRPLVPVLGVLSVVAASSVGVLTAGATPAPEQTYVVVLKDPAGVTRAERPAAMASTTRSAVQSARHLGATIEQEFLALGGYTARMTPAAAARLASSPQVSSIAPDVEVQAVSSAPAWTQGVSLTAGGVQNNPKWHLDRIDQVGGLLDKKYAYPATGKGVHVYIMDSGTRSTHKEFTGRHGKGVNIIKEGTPPEDDNGHGSHVASSALGTELGVAKEATLHSVKILNSGGSNTVSGTVKGMDWIIANGEKPGVANLSLTLQQEYKPLNDGVKKLIDAGYTAVVSAGNDVRDACGNSPSMLPEAITVAASSRWVGGTSATDSFYTRSNFGKCVDVIAPGDFIDGAGHKTDDEVVSKSGTSMAAPVTAGVVALYLEKNPTATPAQVQEALVKGAVASGIADLKGTPDRMVNVNFIK